MKIAGINSQDLSWIVETIKKVFPDTRILAFGSGVTGKPSPRKYSDIDIALDSKKTLDAIKLNHLDHIFTESDFPIIVDISDYHRFDTDFKKIVDETAIEL